MEESQSIQHFVGKTILIIGATGFLAKIFTEKILRLQPNVHKIYLLIRASTERDVELRLQEEVLGKEIFGVLRELCGEDFKSFVSSKIVAIAGDTASENLGIIDAQLREEMWEQIDIIVNSAATTKFDERYDVSFGTNTMGAMHVQQFATKCSKLEKLLHVSTAYVNCTGVGVVTEKTFGVGETLDGAKIPTLDIMSEKKIIEENLRDLRNKNLSQKEINIAMKKLGIQRAKLHGWPNTYVFTKAMGEMVLESFKEKCKVIIIRPTIITSTFKDPFPGWIEGVRTLDGIFVSLAKGNLKCFVGDPVAILDLIPGDMVVNCMVAAIATNLSDTHDSIVYQVGSSRLNPVKYEDVKLSMFRYLAKHPFIDSTGKPIKVSHVTSLETMSSFHNYIRYRYVPPLKILGLINMICCKLCEGPYSNAERSINRVKRLAELYKPFVFSKQIYDDSYTQNLGMRLGGSNELNFDPKCIVWDDYLFNTHFPGLVKYELN